ncbi:MAG: fluoride efflux transporter CrcB [Acidimicrobiales bacterium]
MNALDVLWVGLAGSLGAVARFAADGAVRGRLATDAPVGTVLVNLSGSLILGFVTGLVLYHSAPSTLSLVLGAGFCGGYTTFSTASFETVRLVQRGEYRAALATTLATFFGSVALAGIGLVLASL